MEQNDGRRKALAPLTGLKPDEETFALHLRAIRDQLGMTSAEIAERLDGIEATRLSKCLSGKSLPQPSILTELHRLLEEKAGIPSSSQAAAGFVHYQRQRLSMSFSSSRTFPCRGMVTRSDDSAVSPRRAGDRRP
ncbi:helix-turn-helix domain-containing protein [Streptomyces sp. NPDC055134]